MKAISSALSRLRGPLILLVWANGEKISQPLLSSLIPAMLWSSSQFRLNQVQEHLSLGWASLSVFLGLQSIRHE